LSPDKRGADFHVNPVVHFGSTDRDAVELEPWHPHSITTRLNSKAAFISIPPRDTKKLPVLL
jgi:hypothetical protein